MRIRLAICVALLTLSVAGVANAGNGPRASALSGDAFKVHKRAKRALGAGFACVSHGSRSQNGENIEVVDLRVSSKSVVRKAKRVASRIETAGEITVSVVARKFRDDSMRRLTLKIQRAAPEGGLLVYRQAGYELGGAPDGACPPVMIEADGPAGSEALDTPEYKWALEQSERYGADRVKASPRRVNYPQ